MFLPLLLLLLVPSLSNYGIMISAAADMPELMGPALFQNMDPAQLAQLQKMAAQVSLGMCTSHVGMGHGLSYRDRG